MSDAAVKMDAIYRLQRHIYDITRKPYLLGRDTLIRELVVPASGTVLEIGCGTARNLLGIARNYPTCRCLGIDVSSAMLQTARASIKREGADRRVCAELADATHFDPALLFDVNRIDCIVISYALSMIPQWKTVLRHAVDLLAPDGVLHIVDFGDQAGLPTWFRNALFAWLKHFSVTPRLDLEEQMAEAARATGCSYQVRKLFRGYAILGEIRAH